MVMLSSPEIIKEKDQLQIESPVNHKKQKDNFLVFLSATHDEEELFNSWKVLAKSKGMLENGDRLENASWRRWYQRKYNIQQISKKEIVSMKKHSKLSKETPSAPCLEEILGSPWNDKTLDGHSKSEPTTLKLKKKKKVRFDESKNQTTFLCDYPDDCWDDSRNEMLINVDELSRIRHSKINGFYLRPQELDMDSLTELKEETNHKLKTLQNNQSYSNSNSRQKDYEIYISSDVEDEDEDDEDGIIDSVFWVAGETISIAKWCAGVMFWK